MADCRETKDDQKKVRGDLAGEIRAQAVHRRRLQQSACQDFRKTTLPGRAKTVRTLPFPESPVYGGGRGFFPRNAVERCLRSWDQAGGGRKLAARGCGPVC